MLNHHYTSTSILTMRSVLFLLMFSWFTVASSAAVNQTQTKPGCQPKCGNVDIPYPFGIGANCSISAWSNINCNTTFNPPKPFIGSLEVTEFSPTEVRIKNFISTSCYNDSLQIKQAPSDVSLYGTPYTFSSTKNKFTAVGCDTTVVAQLNEGKHYVLCTTICAKREDVIEGLCSGIGCCQTSLPKGMKSFYILVGSVFNHSRIMSFDSCGSAFMAEQDKYTFKMSDFTNTASLQDVPIVLNFALGNQTCKQARKNTTSFACKKNSYCYNSEDAPGYLCNCNKGYEGNPYLNQGCQGLGFGFLFLLVGGSWIHLSLKKRKHLKLKEKFFQQNGGLLLKQQISSNEDGVESSKVFTEKELKLATNNYDEHRILGQGGSGTVYRGILPDLRIVAIKKSKAVDVSQLGQFINEVVILTQVNHRNVVKLLGCCLETEVPLLVYEYVSNGSLFHHVHRDSRKLSSISWEDRLRIAAETAGALAYLHSAASIPIIHRDVKSANILLDDNYTAKVADFGASRLNPLDETQISTLVQGTMGYLDPEYFHTGQLTDKSDVYSFGVVLAELLTGEKPLSFERSQEQRHLATYFILSMKENRLVLEPGIVNDGKSEEAHTLAGLAKRCLNMKGDERPPMKEVAAELEGLRGFKKSSLGQKSEEDTPRLYSHHVDLYAVPSDTNSYSTEDASDQYSLQTALMPLMSL